MLPVKDVRESAVEKLAVGRGHLKAEGVEAHGNHFAFHFEAGRSREILQDLPVAVPHRPSRSHVPMLLVWAESGDAQEISTDPRAGQCNPQNKDNVMRNCNPPCFLFRSTPTYAALHCDLVRRCNRIRQRRLRRDISSHRGASPSAQYCTGGQFLLVQGGQFFMLPDTHSCAEENREPLE
jgi:hypothetical protein